jgi:hypothetical protein
MESNVLSISESAVLYQRLRVRSLKFRNFTGVVVPKERSRSRF